MSTREILGEPKEVGVSSDSFGCGFVKFFQVEPHRAIHKGQGFKS